MNGFPSTRRLDRHFMAMQTGYWAMFASICAYMAALLLNRGFSNGEIGIIIAVRCLAGIICQPILGGFADRHPEIPLRLIVTLSLSLSFCAGLAFYFAPMGMTGTLVVFFVVGGFEVSAYPFMDAMAIQYINAGIPIRYSLGRGIGSLSYAVCCIFLGLQTAHMGVESILLTHAGLVLVEILLVGTYPVFRAEKLEIHRAPEAPHSLFYLLKSNPRFALMLAGILCGLTGVLPMSNFLVNIILDRGGTTGNLGLGLFLMAASELLTAFAFQRLLRRFGSGKLLLLSLVFCALKSGLLLLAPGLFWVYLIQPIQMLGYGLFTPASVFYVNESVPASDRVRGQTIMMVASNGLGGVLGSLLAGWVLDVGGVNLMLLCCAAIGALGVVLAALALRGTKPLQHQ